RASGTPVLLSLTATWCHACHRMDDETWDDPAVAAAVERSTVPVRVDADARPDVYSRYHLGGLPSTALLTADGEFVRGGTFLSRLQFFAFLEAALDDVRVGRRPSRATFSRSTRSRASEESSTSTVEKGRGKSRASDAKDARLMRESGSTRSFVEKSGSINLDATTADGTRHSFALAAEVRDGVIAPLVRGADPEHR